MQALSQNGISKANYDNAMRVKGNVERMAARLLKLDNTAVDQNPTDQVVQSERFRSVSLDGNPDNAFAVRGTASKGADESTSSASVEVLMGVDTASFSHGPKQVLDGAGKVIATLQEYKIDSPAGTQTATFNMTNGTITFTDKPIPDCLW